MDGRLVRINVPAASSGEQATVWSRALRRGRAGVRPGGPNGSRRPLTRVPAVTGFLAFVVLVFAGLSATGQLTAVATAAQTPTTTTPTTVAPTTTRPVGSSTTTTTTTAPPNSTTTTAVPSSSSTTSSTSTTSTSLAPGVLVPPNTLPASQLDELRKLQEDMEGATSEELDLFRRFLDAQQQAIDLAGRVDVLNASVGTVKLELLGAEQKVAAADKAVQAAEERLAEAEAQLEKERTRLRARAVEAYIGGGSGGGNASTDAIMRSATMDDLGKTLVYSDVIVSDQRATVARVAELRDEVERLRAEAAQAWDAAVAARDGVAHHKVEVEAQLLEQIRVAESIKRTADEVKGLLEEVAKKREAYAARINLLTRVSDGISETLRKAQEGQKELANTTGVFISPLVNPVFNSPFGPRVHPLLGTARMHNGVDLNGTTGTPIRAPADGVVLIASDVSGYGNTIVIDHGSGLGTLYGHQSAFNVKVGDIVKKGDVIGFVGSTGQSTGPHLHWEVRKFGQPVDPIPFIGPG